MICRRTPGFYLKVRNNDLNFDLSCFKNLPKEYVAPPVYLIGLMGVPIEHADMSKWRDRYVAEYTFREKETQDLLDETIFIIFAEIARFDKRQDECVSVQERMLYVLKHSQDIKKPTDWLTEGIYARLLHAFEVAKFMKGKLIRYIRDMMDERKRVSEMNTYERRGRAEGKVQERMANARKMKELGMDIALICQVTGLSEQQVLEL